MEAIKFILKVVAAIVIPLLLLPATIIAGLAFVFSNDNWSFWQTLLALDKLLNVILGGNAHEYLSSTAWRRRGESKKWASTRLFIDFIFSPWEQEHCRKQYLAWSKTYE